MWTERRGGEASVCPRELLHRDKNRNPRDWFLFPRRSQLRIPDAGFRGLHPEPGSPHPDASPPHRGVSVFLIDAILPPRATPAGCRGPVCPPDATSGVAGGMTIAIRIRRLRLADYDAMVRLLRLCGLNPRTKGRESRTSIAAQLRTPRNRYLGAFEGARLVGTVFGTHDGRKGWINRLAVHPDNRSLNRFAIAESPSMTGVIGVALRPMSNPIETSRFLKYFVFDHSFFTCRGSVSSTSIAAVQAAATAGGWEPLSSHVLDLFKAKFLRSFDPATYPPTTPRAFENVPSWTWILSSTWKCDATPRPPSPRTPSPCASSMYTMAPNASLRCAIWSTGAMSPSIENTPSLTTRIFFAN